MTYDLIILLIVLAVFLISLTLAFLVYYIIKGSLKNSSSHHDAEVHSPNAPSPGQIELKAIHELRKKAATPNSELEESNFCKIHPKEHSMGSCLMCEGDFCEDCLIEHDSLYFCKEHFKIFANNQWEKISDVLTTAETPEASFPIYKFKRNLWENEGRPSFVVTHYKINVSSDHIESYVQLHVKKDDALELKKSLDESL
jgi:hypothetical protein